MKNLVILSAARTPIGSFLGKLSSLSAPALGSVAIKAALARAGVAPGEAEQVVFGNVLQAGIGQAPARQASLGAGIPNTVPCVTVHKVCGSGMRAVMDVGNAIQAGEYEVVVAGGMESMSNAPYLLDKARTGLPHGQRHARRLDDQGRTVGPLLRTSTWATAPSSAPRSTTSRARSRTPSRSSRTGARRTRRRRASSPTRSRPVEVPQKKGDPLKIDADEEPFSAPLEKMPTLKPAFQKDGTVTAANASKINDGAAALVVTSRGEGEGEGLEADRPDRRVRRAWRRRPSGSRRHPSARSRSCWE